MKKAFISFCLVSLAALQLVAQKAKPELLTGPANWEFERFDLPPAFAPGISYKGFEELRFAPGMFKKDSANYFAYAFVASIEGDIVFTQKQVQDYLLHYYKGLCWTVANDAKMKVDTSAVTAVVSSQKEGPGKTALFEAVLGIFGVFVDGQPLNLNMEITAMQDTAHHRTYLYFIASPQPKGGPVWTQLKNIRQDFKMP